MRKKCRKSTSSHFQKVMAVGHQIHAMEDTETFVVPVGRLPQNQSGVDGVV